MTSQRAGEAGQGGPGGLKKRFNGIRRRHPFLDHAIRAWQHYGDRRGNELAGAVTYFAFLSFFPLLALTFAVVGFLADAYPPIEQQVTAALTTYLPGLVGNGSGQIQVQQLLEAREAALGLGALGLLYSGLGWVDGLREALRQVFVLPVRAGNLVVKKLTDLVALLTLGVGALLALTVSTVATALTAFVLDAVGVGESFLAQLLFRVLAPLLSIGVTTLMLVLVFTRLPGRVVPWREAIEGAVLGAVVIQILLLVGGALIGRTTANPVYAPVAVVVGLLVWMNLVSRVTLLAASWTATDTRVAPLTQAEAESPAVTGADSTGGAGRASAGTHRSGRRSRAEGAPAPSQRSGRRSESGRPTPGTRPAASPLAVLAIAALVAARRNSRSRNG